MRLPRYARNDGFGLNNLEIVIARSNATWQSFCFRMID